MGVSFRVCVFGKCSETVALLLPSKTKYDAEVMQKLDAVNTDVVRKRTDLAAMPNELLALKEQFAALELKNENMMREKRNITQDIESATKTRDSLKLLSKQEVKEWSGE